MQKAKILIRSQVKFLVFYMFSGFLLFGHNLSRIQNYNSLTQQTTSPLCTVYSPLCTKCTPYDVRNISNNIIIVIWNNIEGHQTRFRFFEQNLFFWDTVWPVQGQSVKAKYCQSMKFSLFCTDTALEECRADKDWAHFYKIKGFKN